ncbi:metabotropic glutamate receptor 3-like isoform X2 [Dendronephthya gigantea]|uniref:metabotropic glutamate receptor 3-like isoform X2 n=1 Tax=Dendronephthya gigantea TaxID=151771 RepID=UPI0010699774|nr:metabotropic glutamate receptor 3-like isoform X2 [Dendronephthya gigantea]
MRKHELHYLRAIILSLIYFAPTVLLTYGKHRAVRIGGNITLGGLFPIHSDDRNGKCSSINGVLGIQRLEAMIYAIKRINTEGKILPGINLGLSAFDTCSSETTALDRTVEEFITDQRCDDDENGAVGGRQVVGVVGPLYSSVSVQVAHLLRLFKMPQISYDSTSSELSDNTKYEYFLRTVPSDLLQARAIVDILKYFGWSYVSVVYSDDSYGRNGIEGLSKEMEKKDICIAVRGKISQPEDDEKMEKIINELLAETHARVVVVFCSKKETIKSLLRAAKSRNAIDQFQWIGSDSWITVSWLGEFQSLANGLISVQPMSNPVEAFREHLLQQIPSSNDVNPWFKEYFVDTLKCNLLSHRGSDSYPGCGSKHTLRSANLTIDYGVTRTIDAVYAYAYALRKIRTSMCGSPRIFCDAMKEISGENLLNVLKNITFESIDGNTIFFDENGDVHSRYDVYYFNRTVNNRYENVRIGQWIDNLTMYRITKDDLGHRESFCGMPCEGHEVKQGITGKPSCCWKCAACTGNQLAFNQTHCKTCARGFWPDTGKQQCVQIPPRYFTLNTDYVGLHLVLPPLVVSILGFISVICVAVIFAKFNQTPLVKASGRELSYLLLTGLFFCYAMLVVCLLKPSPYVCLVEFLLDSLPFTICYAAVIVKTNRISRIFNRRNLTKRPQFIHPQSQICFSFVLVAVQVMLLTAFCLLQLPREKLLYLSESDVVLICAISDKDFLLSQIYNFVLIIICTYYAFKTRRSPMNFNEAKYIAFAMYCTCVLWLAFITVYLVQTDAMLKACIRCLSISLIATILLVCLFVPKVYIILLKPSENRKRPTLPSHSISSLNGDQAAGRSQGLLPNEANNSRALDCVRYDGTIPRGTYRPRSSTDPRRFDSDRRSWRYSLPPDQFSHSTAPRKLEREEEMELEMKALIERLAVLESLLHQQRQATGSYQTREIQGALKSCQSLMAEVNKQGESSIPECVRNCTGDHCSCPPQTSNPSKSDNRSLLMTYAQSAIAQENPKDSGTVAQQQKKTNGTVLTVPNSRGRFKSSNENSERMGLLEYRMSPIQRKSASEA